jgi:hypothetical protein
VLPAKLLVSVPLIVNVVALSTFVIVTLVVKVELLVPPAVIITVIPGYRPTVLEHVNVGEAPAVAVTVVRVLKKFHNLVSSPNQTLSPSTKSQINPPPVIVTLGGITISVPDAITGDGDELAVNVVCDAPGLTAAIYVPVGIIPVPAVWKNPEPGGIVEPVVDGIVIVVPDDDTLPEPTLTGVAVAAVPRG